MYSFEGHLYKQCGRRAHGRRPWDSLNYVRVGFERAVMSGARNLPHFPAGIALSPFLPPQGRPLGAAYSRLERQETSSVSITIRAESSTALRSEERRVGKEYRTRWKRDQ